MKQRIWSGFLMLVLAALGTLWFFSRYEQREDIDHRPPSEAAQTDPFLAAQRLLKRFQVDASSRNSLAALRDIEPRSRPMVVIPERRGALSPNRLRALREFVEHGGHLLIESEAAATEDPLLDTFEIVRSNFEDSDDSGYRFFRKHWNNPTASAPLADDDLMRVKGDRAEALFVHLHGPQALHMVRAVNWRIGGHRSSRALRVKLGRGSVTAVNDLRFANNWSIGRNDNAEFFWQLVNGTGHRPARVIFVRFKHPGLLQWIGEHAWRVATASAVLIGLWLWALMPRFGPISPDPIASNRRLGDHLQASGRLLWSQGEAVALGKSAREGALARLYAEFPHLAALPPDAQVRFLQQRTAADRTFAGQLLGENRALAADAFTAFMRGCAALHARLGSRPPASS